jgi:hypothetical protein
LHQLLAETKWEAQTEILVMFARGVKPEDEASGEKLPRKALFSGDDT